MVSESLSTKVVCESLQSATAMIIDVPMVVFISSNNAHFQTRPT